MKTRSSKKAEPFGTFVNGFFLRYLYGLQNSGITINFQNRRYKLLETSITHGTFYGKEEED